MCWEFRLERTLRAHFDRKLFAFSVSFCLFCLLVCVCVYTFLTSCWYKNFSFLSQFHTYFVRAQVCFVRSAVISFAYLYHFIYIVFFSASAYALRLPLSLHRVNIYFSTLFSSQYFSDMFWPHTHIFTHRSRWCTKTKERTHFSRQIATEYARPRC